MKWILENLSWLIPAAGIPITWLFSKRKYQQRELKSQDVDIMSKNITVYQTLLDDLEQRYEDRLKKLEEYYQNEIDNLEKKMLKLKSELETLKKKYESSNNREV